MADRNIKIPGPEHPITIERNPKRVTITLNGRTIADTTAALTLREAQYAAVQYIPRRDVDMTALARSPTRTYCPYKGDASYFSILDDGERSIDAIWTYEAPFGAVAAIEKYMAFYPDRVDVIEERAS